MANDLYLEAEKEIKASPTVKMDERGIYDDIEPVKIDVEVPPSLKLEVPIKADPEKTAKIKLITSWHVQLILYHYSRYLTFSQSQ